MRLRSLPAAVASAAALAGGPATASTFLVDVEAAQGPFIGTLYVDSAIDTSAGYDAHAIVGFTGSYDGQSMIRFLNGNFPFPNAFAGLLFDQVYTTDLEGVVGPSFGPFGALFCSDPANLRCVHLGSGNGPGVQVRVFASGVWGPTTQTELTFTPQAVPEPATWALMILGFGGAGAALRYRRRQTASA